MFAIIWRWICSYSYNNLQLLASPPILENKSLTNFSHPDIHNKGQLVFVPVTFSHTKLTASILQRTWYMYRLNWTWKAVPLRYIFLLTPMYLISHDDSPHPISINHLLPMHHLHYLLPTSHRPTTVTRAKHPPIHLSWPIDMTCLTLTEVSSPFRDLVVPLN